MGAWDHETRQHTDAECKEAPSQPPWDRRQRWIENPIHSERVPKGRNCARGRGCPPKLLSESEALFHHHCGKTFASKQCLAVRSPGAAGRAQADAGPAAPGLLTAKHWAPDQQESLSTVMIKPVPDRSLAGPCLWPSLGG